MKQYITIENPAHCCGCGACANACPKNAITMQEDAAGFIFPAVDETLCVACGRCIDVCVFRDKHKGENGEPAVYAAATRDREILLQSSSGGIFSELAGAVLERGGAVFGAAWTKELTLEHCLVKTPEDLQKLRGSKYVQSDTADTFRQAKKLLDAGSAVCYCGTPCQIAGLKAFLGKDYEDLLTVDLVCHGVPSMKMLRDDLEAVTGGKTASLQDIRFRDKRYKWGVKGSLTYTDSIQKYDAGSSPYYFYFLKGEVYRESCYQCRFPSENRQGDITLGDYWGVRKALLAKMGCTDLDAGASCVLVNSEKGKRWFDIIAPRLSLAQSDRASAEKRNKQLTAPSKPLPEHEILREGYIQNGYVAFQSGYKKHFKDHLVRTVKDMIPSKIKRALNELRG